MNDNIQSFIPDFLPFTYSLQISFQNLLQLSAILCFVASQSYFLWDQNKLQTCLLVSYHQLKPTFFSQINTLIDNTSQKDIKSPSDLIEKVFELISDYLSITYQ